MYFNSQFFPQMGGMMAGHPGMQGSMHSMNMLYMDSLNRQDQCSSGTGHAGLHAQHEPLNMLYMDSLNRQDQCSSGTGHAGLHAQHEHALHGLPQQTGPVLLSLLMYAISL